jgi:hypothetical protein
MTQGFKVKLEAAGFTGLVLPSTSSIYEGR